MAITVDPLTDGDFTRINRADATTGWTAAGQWAMIALDTAAPVENTGNILARVSAGIGSATANFTSRSLENVHLRHWVKLGQSMTPFATYGGRLIIGVEANHGSWEVYDDQRQVVVYNGWMMFVVDPRKPYDATVGTQPTDILAVTDAGCRVDFVDANGKDLAVADMIWEGNEVSVEGGTTGARGTFAEWVTDDESNGYGILRPVGGIYYMNAGAVFQGVGTATSYFEDENQIIVFEDLPVSGSLYKFRHVGNSTGTNHFQLGTTSGSGVDQEGAGGGVIRAAGAAPFRIEAIDANVDAVNYYGVTMLGPSTIYADQFRNVKVEDNGTGFTDITSNATGPDLAAVAAMPATVALNDATYYGHDERFYGLTIDFSISKGISQWIGTWEYYNGSTWVSLTDVTDGTANYISDGTVTWAIPDDWAANTVDSDTRYWVRFRVSSFTSHSATPTFAATGQTCDMAGDIRIEDPNVDMVGCSLTSMGSIRVRNGAFLKKCTIDSSVVPAKHAAVDLGALDPAANTVRDLSIANGSKGILVKDYTRFLNAAAAVDKGGGKVGIPSTAHGFPTGRSITIAGTTNYNNTYTVDATSTANEIVITETFTAETFSTTDTAVPNGVFNLRGIQFVAMTDAVRVDFPATSTVDLNLLDGTTALVAGDIDNVNSSTVNINNTVNLTFTPLELNSEVRVFLTGTNTEVDGIENSGASFVATVDASVALDYKIINPGFKEIFIKNVSFAASQNVQVNQLVDRDFDPVD